MPNSEPLMSAERPVTVHDEFEELLEGAPGRRVSFPQFAKVAMSRGRVLLQAPAGAGKTSCLIAFMQAIESEHTADYIDLSRLDASERTWRTPDDAEEWLWAQFSARGLPRFLCLDSLDEIPVTQGQNLLDAVERATNRAPGCSVIVADRLGRRRLRANRWALASLALLPKYAALDSTEAGAQHHWRRLPYFVHLSRTYGGGSSPADLIGRRLASLLSPEELSTLAPVGLEAWASLGQSVMDRDWLEERIGPQLIHDLDASGLLRAEGADRYAFEHVLLHGYLAAHSLAGNSDLWDKSRFDAVTFDGASFDALGMLLAMVPDSQVDSLVRRVDDWNFYAAAYLLAEDYDAGNRTSASLSSALLLLLGLRRFSPVPSTRMQVEDSLRLHPSSLAERVLHARDVNALIELAETLDIHGSWWSRWVGIFGRKSGEGAWRDDVEALQGDDGVIAWTAANVLLRSSLSAEIRSRLADITVSALSDGSRWRAVHVLGGASDLETLSVLLQSFRSDPSKWVRTGALRSSILVAARLEHPEDRAGFFANLAAMSDALLAHPKWLREIERSTQMDSPPTDWPEAVGVLLEELWARADTIEEQDRWRRLSASLRTQWTGASKLGTL